MSDAGNRDDSLERLLRKARPMLGGSSTPEACLDAETVAAWAGGGLAGDELERAQLHTAGCTRCQALVALMVRIDPATVTDEVPAPSSRAWIGWLVPLTAAAGLTLFVLTRGPGPAQVPMPLPPSSASLSTAPIAPPGGGATPAPAPTPSIAGRESAARAADPAARLEASRQATNQQTNAPIAPMPDPAMTVSADASRATGNQAAPIGLSQAQQTMGGVVGGIAPPPPPTATPVLAEPKAAAGTPTFRAGQAQAQQAQMTLPPPPAPAIAPPPPATPPPPPPAAPVPAMAERVLVAPPPPPSSAQATSAVAGGAGRGGFAGGRGGGGGGGGRGGAPIALDAVASVELGTVVVAPPDSTVRWRATGALVERSTDAGATWQFVARVVDANFRAASSPSPLVCWFVGRDGVVVVFTEGRTARAVTFPELVHLTSVRATDERTATVTTINGREYSTSDAGQSWNVR